MMSTTVSEQFEKFFREAEPRLRRAYTGRVATARVGDCVSAALEHAWSDWDRVGAMDHPVAYLFRVGLSKSRSRRQGQLPPAPPRDQAHVEPGLVTAMRQLPRRQREVVWLVDACEWTAVEAAEALGVSPSAVRTHRERGLQRLRLLLGVETDA